MNFLWASEYDSYKTIEEFFENINSEKLCPFPSGFVKEGFHASPEGISEICFITNPMDEKSRTERAFMILESKNSRNINFRINKSTLMYKVPIKVTKKALRTITGVKSFSIGSKHDFIIMDKYEDFKTVLSLTRFKNKKSFNWNIIREKVKNKSVHLVFVRRFNLYSKNSYFLSFYSDKPIVVPHTLKIAPNVEKDEAKIICLFFNSIVNIIQILINKSQTTGSFADVQESDLLEFQIINFSALNKNEIKSLLDTFNKLKVLTFPSIVEQIESRFYGRIELDKSILKILGYTNSQINELLPKLYEVVLKELQVEF